MFNVATDALDRQPVPEVDNLFANWALVRPITPRQLLAHDRDAGCGLVVALAEISAGFERNPERAEVAGTDRTNLGRVTGRLVRSPFHLDAVAPIVPAERQMRDHGRALRPRERAHLRQRVAVKGQHLRFPGIAILRHHRVRRDHVFRRKTGIDVHQPNETAQHQRAADEQHGRERHLRENQRVARAGRAAGRARRATERIVQVGARAAAGGPESEK